MKEHLAQLQTDQVPTIVAAHGMYGSQLNKATHETDQVPIAVKSLQPSYLALGHLHEMMDGRLSSVIYADQVLVFDGAMECAEEFLLTAAGQKNRNHLEGYVQFEDVSFGMEEVLYDPQTSGGLLFAVPKAQADELCEKLQKAGLPAAIVGEVTEQKKSEILSDTFG